MGVVVRTGMAPLDSVGVVAQPIETIAQRLVAALGLAAPSNPDDLVRLVRLTGEGQPGRWRLGAPTATATSRYRHRCGAGR